MKKNNPYAKKIRSTVGAENDYFAFNADGSNNMQL